MTYQDWAEQYFESARKIKDRVSVLNEEVKTATLSEAEDLKNRIRILMSMYRDCMDTGNELVKRKGEI